MRKANSCILLFLGIILVATTSFGQASKLAFRLIQDSSKDEHGYINSRGDTVVPLGKYLICYTEKFGEVAIVKRHDRSIVGINQKENILFQVFEYDNGPDYPSGGLLRIVKDGKIGYADVNGHIVIPPQFDGAYPFQHGRAKVGRGCKKGSDEEHSWWTGGDWYLIDKKGRSIEPYRNS